MVFDNNHINQTRYLYLRPECDIVISSQYRSYEIVPLVGIE